MFDIQTAELLRSAPSVPGLDANQIPQLLTRQYARLVSARLRAGEDEVDMSDESWPLERLADTYEIVAAIETTPELRRAAAFVAGTAQQIISRKQSGPDEAETHDILDRDRVNASVAAALLFLVAEQYADASEAGAAISQTQSSYEVRILGEHVKDLARGKLDSILLRAARWRRTEALLGAVQNRALRALASVLSEGIELLAADMMSAAPADETPDRFQSARAAFQRVIELSSNEIPLLSEDLGGRLVTTYPGPAHMASLLLSAADALGSAALTKLPPPSGADPAFWNKWLRLRAKDMPFVWQNHREAIDEGFYQSGVSAVLVLPTGAGKTTVATLKIAGTLARGKKVVFLAPTHALVEQLTEDLQAMFPKEQFEFDVSSDFDSLLIDDTQLHPIEVMTPERCLAMLSFSPESFKNVGLLVFDECHLLSPQPGRIGRSLDGMLCLLTFSSVAPDADMLFLSAMLDNGPSFSEWIEELTARKCIAIELFWKPSRQARGVVVYEEADIESAIDRALSAQRALNKQEGKSAKGLRVGAKRMLTAVPNAVWGLQHNWMAVDNSISFTKILDEEVQLGAGFARGHLWVTPNANATAARIAVSAAGSQLKTIIFVNTKADAVSTARNIASDLGTVIPLLDSESNIWDALMLEVGHTRHSIFGAANFAAVPHNAAMLRLERALSERLFRRAEGAKVIVATPTLAQGLNLPAHLAILAGDKRSGEVQGTREDLEAHEVLNAAARAGRAGHLANGIVLLIPEPLMTFSSTKKLGDELEKKLASILPEDDRCVTITDPLEIVLDRVMEGDTEDREVKYTVNRLAALGAAHTEGTSQDHLMARSFGAFLAKERGKKLEYLNKIEEIWTEVKGALDVGPTEEAVLLASQSGLPLDLLERLRTRLKREAGSLPQSIPTWVDWVIAWLSEDALARDHLLQDVGASALSAAGRPAKSSIDGNVLAALGLGVQSWIAGKPLPEIENALGGDPESNLDSLRICPRARDLISTFIPRALSFTMGVVARMVDELDLKANQADLDETLIQSLASAVRRGFDSQSKLEFANSHREMLGRVQIHQAYKNRFLDSEFDDEEL